MWYIILAAAVIAGGSGFWGLHEHSLYLAEHDTALKNGQTAHDCGQVANQLQATIDSQNKTIDGLKAAGEANNVAHATTSVAVLHAVPRSVPVKTVTELNGAIRGWEDTLGGAP